MTPCSPPSEDALDANFMELRYYRRITLSLATPTDLLCVCIRHSRETTNPENFMELAEKCIKNFKEQFKK